MKMKPLLAGLVMAGALAPGFVLAESTTNAVPIQDLAVVSEKGDLQKVASPVDYRERRHHRHHRRWERRGERREWRRREWWGRNHLSSTKAPSYPSPQVVAKG